MLFHTTYRWDPARFKEAARRFVSLFDGSAPQVVQDAMQKFQDVQMWYSMPNACFYAVYNLAPEDIPLVQAVGIYLADVFTLETIPVVSADDHNRVWDMFPDDFL